MVVKNLFYCYNVNYKNKRIERVVIMHLYVVRHGTTDNNVNHLVNGRNDIDLNEQGIKEAGRVSLALKDIKFDMVYCSPLLRAKHTMQIINCNNLPVTYDERIIERDAGVMTNRPESEIDFKIWNRLDIGVIYGGSESFKEVLNRVSSFIDELKKKHENDTVLVVAHAGVMKAMEIHIFGDPGIEIMEEWTYPNCTVKEYIL